MFGWGLPVVVAAFLAWLGAAPATIGDMAQREAIRRALTPKSTHTYSNNDLIAWSAAYGAPATATAAPPDAPPPAGGAVDPASAAAATPPAEPAHDEAWWSGRIISARGALTRDTLLAEAVQSRINALTSDVVGRDDPAQKAQLDYQRRQAMGELDRLHKDLENDQKAVADIQEEARRAGVPPGWVR